MQRRLQLNPSFWFTVIAYAICGASLFVAASSAARVFTKLDGSFPIPICVVVYVGPLGWSALALLGAAGTLWVRSTPWRLFSTIIFSLLTFGVLFIVRNTSLDIPSRISASNECVEPTAGRAFCFSLESLAGGGSRWRSLT
jgi:cell division protein FtsW (lipid II flippase)